LYPTLTTLGEFRPEHRLPVRADRPKPIIAALPRSNRLQNAPVNPTTFVDPSPPLGYSVRDNIFVPDDSSFVARRRRNDVSVSDYHGRNFKR